MRTTPNPLCTRRVGNQQVPERGQCPCSVRHSPLSVYPHSFPPSPAPATSFQTPNLQRSSCSKQPAPHGYWGEHGAMTTPSIHSSCSLHSLSQASSTLCPSPSLVQPRLPGTWELVVSSPPKPFVFFFFFLIRSGFQLKSKQALPPGCSLQKPRLALPFWSHPTSQKSFEGETPARSLLE